MPLDLMGRLGEVDWSSLMNSPSTGQLDVTGNPVDSLSEFNIRDYFNQLNQLYQSPINQTNPFYDPWNPGGFEGPPSPGPGQRGGGGSGTGNSGGIGKMGFPKKLGGNKLLGQYLGSYGQDLMQNTPGKNMGAAIQGNIATQNYAKLLSEILGGGEVPEGVTHTRKGSEETIKFDRATLGPKSMSESPSAAKEMSMGNVTDDISRFLKKISPFQNF